MIGRSPVQRRDRRRPDQRIHRQAMVGLEGADPFGQRLIERRAVRQAEPQAQHLDAVAPGTGAQGRAGRNIDLGKPGPAPAVLRQSFA